MSDALNNFLQNCILFPDIEVESLGIEKIRNQPGQRVHDEVKVIMSRHTAREHIASKGRMLSNYVDCENKPTTGIRMGVPDFLASDFKLLDCYGLRMKNIHTVVGSILNMTSKTYPFDLNYAFLGTPTGYVY